MQQCINLQAILFCKEDYLIIYSFINNITLQYNLIYVMFIFIVFFVYLLYMLHLYMLLMY
jgi:hypothetical protein